MNQLKCDFGLYLEDNRFFLIECKGEDVGKACKQVASTLNLIKNDQRFKNFKFDFWGRIIPSKVKNVPNVNTQKSILKKILGDDGKNNKLLIKAKFIEEVI